MNLGELLSAFFGYIAARVGALGGMLAGRQEYASVSLVFIALVLALFLFFLILIIRQYAGDAGALRAARKGFAGLSASPSRDEIFAVFGARAGAILDHIAEYAGRLYLSISPARLVAAIWSPRLLNSRFYPSVPSLLTGIGVLGTFIGLLLGLGSLHLEGDLAGLQNEIKSLAEGASIAFETSVWGVALGLLYTVFERRFASRLNMAISELEESVARKLPPLPLGAIAIDIQKNTDQLASQIKINMEASLAEFTKVVAATLDAGLDKAGKSLSAAINDGIGESLQAHLAPEIQRLADVTLDLADRQARNAEEALGRLLQDFSGKLYEAGYAHHQSLAAISEATRSYLQDFTQRVKDAIGEMQSAQATASGQRQKELSAFATAAQNSMDIFGKQVGDSMNAMQGRQDSFAAEIEKGIASLASSTNSNLDKFNEGVEAMLIVLRAKYDESLNERQAALEAMQASFNQVCARQDGHIEKLDSVMKAHLDSTKSVLMQGERLQRIARADRDKLEAATSALADLGSDIKSSSNNLRDFADSIHAGLDRQATIADNSASAIQALIAAQKKSADEFREMANGLELARGSLATACQNLDGSTRQAQEKTSDLADKYTRLQATIERQLDVLAQKTEKQTRDYGDQLARYAGKLDEQAGNLLKDYARETNRQISERMSAWNEQTRDFCAAMKDAVAAIADMAQNIQPGNAPRHD